MNITERNLSIERLQKADVKRIYRAYLKEDFPRAERKPLFTLLKAMDDGIYECYGLMEGPEFLGYAFFVKQNQSYLLDYLATTYEQRNRGLGAAFLGLLKEQIKDADIILAEAENPAFASCPEDARLQERRIGFYLRNGFIDTTLRPQIYGVDFILIELPRQKEHTAEEIRDIYGSIYRLIFPPAVFRKKVRL